MPLDPEPEKRVFIGKSGLAHVVETYTSHFVTCPQSDMWSGKSREEVEG